MCSARLLLYQVHDVLGITSRQFREPSTGDVSVKISWKSTDPGIKMALVISALVIAATAGCRAEVPFFLGNDQFLVRVATTCDEQLAKFGPRFDSSARVDSIRADGQEFLAQEGLIDEFNQRWVPPPGYNDATSAGNVFMKIGVGLLRRTRITPYRFADTYPIEARATTKLIFRNQMLAIFEQSLPLTDGWGYRYRKSYTVDTRTRRLTITYEIENLSFKEIEIDQYNHNWLQLAAASKKTPWILRTPLSVGPASILHCQASPGELVFQEVPEEPAYFTHAQDGRLPKSRTLVSDGSKYISIACDFPASRLSIFTQKNLLAPEIFACFRIRPNHTAIWRRCYEFKTTPPLPHSNR